MTKKIKEPDLDAVNMFYKMSEATGYDIAMSEGVFAITDVNKKQVLFKVSRDFKTTREAELLSLLKEVLEMAIYENEFNRLTAFMDDRLFNLPAIKLNGKRLREIRKKLNL